MPAATTATRAEAFSPAVLFNWVIVETQKLIRDFLLLSYGKHFTSEPKPETEAWKLVDCQVSLFIGDLKSDKREQ
jgi:hypothetical protein